MARTKHIARNNNQSKFKRAFITGSVRGKGIANRGHRGVAGNKVADLAQKQANSGSKPPVPIQMQATGGVKVNVYYYY